MVLGVFAIGARRTDLRGFSCARFVAFPLQQDPWITVTGFSSDTTWSVGGAQIPPGIQAADPNRYFGFFSDTSARTYVFDQDVTDTSSRWGAGAPIKCGAYYAAAGQTYVYTWQNEPYPGWQNFTSRCVSEGTDLRAACEGRTCGQCQLLGPPECFEWNGPGVMWRTGDVDPVQPLVSARVPWERDHNDNWQQVVVATDGVGTNWPHTLKSIRSYDTGACDLTISWSRFASDLSDALFPVLVDQIESDSHINYVSQANLNASVGPMLRGLGQQDEVFLRANIQGSLNAALLSGAADRTFFALTQTRMNVGTQTLLNGGMRIEVPYVTSWTDHVPSEFWDLSDQFAQALSSPSSGLKVRLARALNQALLVPIPNGLQLMGCQTAWAPGGQSTAPRTECIQNIQGSETLFVGQEAGCFPFTEFAPSVLRRPDVQAIRSITANQGLCATRLQPHRVNLLPEGIQVVLIEQGAADPSPDPQYALLHDAGFRFLLGSAGIDAAPAGTSTTGISLDCDSARPDTSAPSGHLVELGAIAEAPAIARVCRTAGECHTCASGGACLCAPGMPCP